MSGNQQPALCFIHGWAFDTRVLENLASHFTSTKVQLIDLPGYGKKQSANQPADIDAVAEAVLPEIPANSVLIGWSLGGMIAIRIAHKIPDAIRAVILLASTPCFVKKNDWPFGVERSLIQDMALRITENTDDVMREFAGLMCMGDSSPRQTIRELKTMSDATSASVETLLAGLDILMNADLRRDFFELRCGIMMISGKNDRLVEAGGGSALRENKPSLKIAGIEMTGHAPFLSREQEVRGAIDNYLQDLVT